MGGGGGGGRGDRECLLLTTKKKYSILAIFRHHGPKSKDGTLISVWRHFDAV